MIKPLFLAEIALSHDGSVGNACALIKLAKENNIDIVKFQDHWSRYESSNEEKFRINFGIDKTRYEYWERTEFNFNEWKYIYDYAEKIDIKLAFSIFSVQSFYRQKDLGNKIWKIGSGELLNQELIDKMLSHLGEDDIVIISTGLSDFYYGLDVSNKFKSKVKEVFLLECVSKYPCDIEDYYFEDWSLHYKNIGEISYGLSDHSGTVWPTIFSWSYGSTLNEFHITFNKKMFGPDQFSSLEPEDLKCLSDAREAFMKLKSKNNVEKNMIKKLEMKKLFGRSIGLKHSLKKGHKIKREDLLMRKPAGGFSYEKIDNLLGKVLKKDINFKEILKPHHFED
tara:strand:- start:1956 stop:2969 length:1014 start_codon:yes stop_codon:yes gene_type:complete